MKKNALPERRGEDARDGNSILYGLNTSAYSFQVKESYNATRLRILVLANLLLVKVHSC